MAWATAVNPRATEDVSESNTTLQQRLHLLTFIGSHGCSKLGAGGLDLSTDQRTRAASSGSIERSKRIVSSNFKL